MLFNLFLLLAVIGLADTVYLVSKRKKSEAPICPLKGDCSFVLNSKYNKIFGVHTDIIGLTYFAAIVLTPIIFTIVWFSGFFVFNQTAGLLLVAVALGIWGATILAFLMTLRMLFIQFFVIKKMCFWCLLSSGCVIGMTAIMVLLTLGVSF